MEQKTYKDYLDKTFLEELNYKIWSTKGSRFNASTRLTQTSRLSNLSINLLSVYLTAVGLLGVYNLHFNQLNEDLIAYSITSLSILALVFGQIESSKDYSLKSKAFHSCGLELSDIYNKLRIFKTMEENPSSTRKTEFTQEISDLYQNVLSKYDNHSPIDNKIFKTKTAKYHELNFIKIFLYQSEYYFRSYFLYHFLIVCPAILLAIIIIYRQ